MRLATQRHIELENLDEQIRALRILGNAPGFRAGSHAAMRTAHGTAATALPHSPWHAISHAVMAVRGWVCRKMYVRG